MQWKHNKYPLILFENVYYENAFLKTMSSICDLDCDKGDLYRNTVDIVAKTDSILVASQAFKQGGVSIDSNYTRRRGISHRARSWMNHDFVIKLTDAQSKNTLIRMTCINVFFSGNQKRS